MVIQIRSFILWLSLHQVYFAMAPVSFLLHANADIGRQVLESRATVSMYLVK
jgi:hypothetical protein